MIKVIFLTTLFCLVVVSSPSVAQQKDSVLSTAVTSSNQVQSFTGTLEMVVGDPRPGSHARPVYKFYFVDDSGKSSELLLHPSILDLQPEIIGWVGKRIEIDAVVLKQPLRKLSVSAMTVISEKSKISQTKFRPTTQRIDAQSGSKPWVTIYCKFADISTEPDNTEFYERMYSNSPGGMNHYWRENSYESINLDGSSSSISWVELPWDHESYMTGYSEIGGVREPFADVNKLLKDCTHAADEFIDFSGFYGINMVFNETLGCCAMGGVRGIELEGIWRAYGVTWLPSWVRDQWLVAHEMGHAYGLPHSNNWDDDEDPYDNPWALMSRGTAHHQEEVPYYGTLGVHTNSYHKYELGWIRGERLLNVNAGSRVTTTLDALGHANTSNHRMAIIPINETSFYTVEARKKIGDYETGIVDDAVIIHEVVRARLQPSWAVDADMPPADIGNNEGTMWRVGETFTNPAGDISISVDAETIEGFMVTIKNQSLEISEKEKNALIELYDNTDGDNWTENTHWLVGDPCADEWFGVQCSSGTILNLNLGNNKLTGVIPSTLGNLVSLQNLNLSGNRLSGSIPMEIGGLTDLLGLSVHGNQLSGSIPVEIGQLSDLEELNLHWNALYTPEPDLDAFLDEKSESDWSATQTIAPDNLRVSGNSSNSVTLAWNLIEYTDNKGSYHVWYKTSSAGPFIDGGSTLNKSNTSHVISGLNTDQGYYFVVTTGTDGHANNANTVISDESSTVVALLGKPPRPTKIRATDGVFPNRVRITFNPVVGATVYRVFRCLTTGGTCGLPIGYPKNGTFDDTRGNREQVYFYRVRACTKSGCGKFSVANTGYSAKTLDKPTDIKASDGTYADHVQVTFNAVEGATVYRVFRCMDTGQTCGLPIGYPNGTDFKDKKGDSGTVYYYRVKACDTAHCSKFSVVNAGHRGSKLSTEGDEEMAIRNDDVPIPNLNILGRWFLILMTLGFGLILVNRRRVRYLD